MRLISMRPGCLAPKQGTGAAPAAIRTGSICRPAHRCGWISRSGSPARASCARCWSGWQTKRGRRDSGHAPNANRVQGGSQMRWQEDRSELRLVLAAGPPALSARRHSRKKARSQPSVPGFPNSAAPANIPRRRFWRNANWIASRRAAVRSTAMSPRALNNLALLYGDQGRDSEAEPLLQASDCDAGKNRRARLPRSARRS